MEGMSSDSSSEYQVQVAPFVAKTYEMVSDPRTDAFIRWGKHNNSFLVLDSAAFSQLILPSFFKHSNFSSFVRQLNTYGFRKVDPDRWEFAHESFLRGQTHLLPLIVRRKRRPDGAGANKKLEFFVGSGEEEEEEEEMVLIEEVGRLRREQRALEEELEGMSKRLQITERRPHQMISFLVKVAEDPDLLPRLVLSKLEQQRSTKKKRLSDQSPPLPCKSKSILTSEVVASLEMGPSSLGAYYSNSNNGVSVFETESQLGGGGLSEFGAMDTPAAAAAATVAYPFSLLGHVFF